MEVVELVPGKLVNLHQIVWFDVQKREVRLSSGDLLTLDQEMGAKLERWLSPMRHYSWDKPNKVERADVIAPGIKA